MGIKASDVKTLRERTGAGMMDCKKALLEADGDSEKAERILKELGLSAADKRAGRATNEGRVFAKIKDGQGLLLELSCETDFVSRNQEFIDLGEAIAGRVLQDDLQDKTDGLESMVKDVASRIKENMGLRRFDRIQASDDELLVSYTHGEGRIGVIVKLKVDDAALKDNEKVGQTAFDLALHIAAFAPLFLSQKAVDESYVKEQEELFMKQVENDPNLQGKPEKVLQSIVKGKLGKHLSTVCLMDQGFVRDEKQKVSKVLEALGKEVGGSVDVSGYLYYKVGEEL